MPTFPRKRFVVWSFASTALLLAIGYGEAFLSKKDCEEDVFADIRARYVRGVGLSGKRIPVARGDVRSTIAAPFAVDVTYLVRVDMHGVIHRERFLVLPGKRILLKSEEFFPL